jgi:hypothetical protein
MAPGPTHRNLQPTIIYQGMCVCIRLTWASALAAQCTLACSTHYPCVYSWRHLAAVRCSRAGAVDQSKPGAFVHPQHCPVVWSVPPSLLTCHAHIYPSPSWVCHAHALPWLWFSFLVIRATLPTHFVEPCALGRWVWGVAKLLVRPRPPPHPLLATKPS